MISAHHDRVKRVFLGALDQTDSHRTAYLDRECGSDTALRRDVDALLNSHSEATVMLVGSREGKAPEPSGSIERFSILFDVLAFLSGTRTRRALLFAGFIALTLAAGYWVRSRARHMLIERAGSALRAVLDGNASTLTLAADQMRSETATLLELPAVHGAIAGLIATPTPDAWQRLSATLDPLLARSHYHSYFVLDPAGNLIATSAGLREGKATASGMAMIGRANRRGASIEFPSPKPNFDQAPADEVVWPRMMLLSGIVAPNGKTSGFLALVQPMDRIAERLAKGRALRSGETYLFREDGLMLTSSRFAADIDRWKLATSAGTASNPAMIYVRDPGRNLEDSAGLKPDDDPASWPLTEVVRVATSRRLSGSDEAEGVILTPYRDYRGVPVIGAWRWMDPLGIGITTEVDEAEVLLALRYVDLPVGVLTLLLLGASVWTVFSSVLLTRLRRRTVSGELLGQYMLVDKLGEGGVGEVYLAQHALLRRPAAVKLLRRDRLSATYLRQFEHEAQAASRLRHPNTVEVYDFGTTRDGTPYYVMEFVPGLDLGRIVAQSGAMPPARAVFIARQVCAALHEAHQMNVIHRDVKPSNVMLSDLAGQYDVVKVLDFGLAKDISNPVDESSPLVRSGTPFYTAPERLVPVALVDRRCDIYSTGALLYFLVCGRTPFHDASNWIDAVLRRDPLPPSQHAEVPAALESLILECLSRDPAERPATARELIERLSNLEGVPLWTQADAEGASANAMPAEARPGSRTLPPSP